MKNNKTKKRWMKVVATAGVLSLCIIPVFTVASCATTWAYTPPVSIGSQFNDPYEKFRPGGTEITYLDGQGQSMNYLPDSYTVGISNAYNYYFFGSQASDWYITDENISENRTSAQLGQYTDNSTVIAVGSNNYYEYDINSNQNSEKWTNYSDLSSNFSTTKNGYTTESVQNSMQYTNASLVGQIGYSIATYMRAAFSYQSAFISTINDTVNNELEAAWLGSFKDSAIFNHGDKNDSLTQEQNDQFVEFCYALSNSWAKGKTDAYLTNISCDFEFNVFPYPTYQDCGFRYYDKDGKQVLDTTHKPTDQTLLLLDPNASVGDIAGNYFEHSTGYTYYSSKTETKKDNVLDYVTYTFENVPIVVTPTEMVYTYTNPKQSSGFLIGDYINDDINSVTNAVGKAWSSMKDPKNPANNKVSENHETKPQYLNWTIDLNNNSNQYFDVDANTTEFTIDQRLTETNQLGSQPVSENSFIVLCNYTYIMQYDETDGGSRNLDQISKDSCSVPTVTGCFPSYLLYSFADQPDVFMEANTSEDITNSIYIINDEMFNYSNKDSYAYKYMDICQNAIAPSKVNQDYIEVLDVLYYMFHDSIGLNDQIDTSFFLFPWNI